MAPYPRTIVSRDTQRVVSALISALLFATLLGGALWITAFVECMLPVGRQVTSAGAWMGLFIALAAVQGVCYIAFLIEGNALKLLPGDSEHALFHHYRMLTTYLSTEVFLSAGTMIAVSTFYDADSERFKQYLTLYVFTLFPLLLGMIYSAAQVLRMWAAMVVNPRL